MLTNEVSRWNEMKVVRSFKHELHPSIIPFYSFIITPSYALITMSVTSCRDSPVVRANTFAFGRAHHPRLVPVEVPEYHAKEWFRSLLSGVEFLHKRGVVHNDIKFVFLATFNYRRICSWLFATHPCRPANILLSTENVPVLVDFGFAERYDSKSTSAFHSNLSYGTPEVCSLLSFSPPPSSFFHKSNNNENNNNDNFC